MPPKRSGRAAAKMLSAHIETTDEGEGQDEVVPPKKAPAKRATRKANTTAAPAEKVKAPARASRKRAASRVEEPTEDDEDQEGEGEEGGKGLDDDGDTNDEEDELDAVAPVRSKRSTVTTATTIVVQPKKEPARLKPRAKGRKAVEEVEPATEGEGDIGESMQVEPEESKPAKRGGRKAVPKMEVVVEKKKKRLTKKEMEGAAKKQQQEEDEKEIAETQYAPMQVDDPAETEIAPTPTQVHTTQAAAAKRGSTGGKKKPPVSKGKGRLSKLQEPITEDDVADEDDDDDLSMKPMKPAPVVPRKGKQVAINGTAEKDNSEAYRELEKAFRELETKHKKLEYVRETEPEKALGKYKQDAEGKEKGKMPYTAQSQTELNADDSDLDTENLIDSLQNDLKTQISLAGESKVLKKKLAAKEAEVTKLQAKIQELNRNLQEQQNEAKVLSAKLSVAQNQRATSTIPGSAVKPGVRGVHGAVKGNSLTGGSEDAKVKEDLFADLTGLLIMNVKKEAQSTVFECLQTGSNGMAVHFKLLVPDSIGNSGKPARKPPAPATAGKDSGDEEDGKDEIVYIPLLDEERDKAIISVLPPFLKDEIGFEKRHMTDFYQKITLFMINLKTKSGGPGGEESSDDDDDEEEEEEEGEEA